MKRKVIWLMPRKQEMGNSASELARETLAGTKFEIVKIERNFLPSLMKAVAVKRSEGLVYFQFGSPVDNLLCALLVACHVPVVAHYLDQIAEGYPKWARRLQLDRPIYYILRNARVVFAISPAMKESLTKGIGRKGQTLVKFRASPDSPVISEDRTPEFPDTVVFTGNINPKTNLSALVEANRLLLEQGLKLAVYTRTNIPSLLDRLKEGGVEVLPPVPASKVVEESNRYAAQLLPFNNDAASMAFYHTSSPSKMPNLLMARRRIIYFGPTDFWLRGWLLDYPDIAMELYGTGHKIELSASSIPAQRAEELLADFDSLSGKITWCDF